MLSTNPSYLLQLGAQHFGVAEIVVPLLCLWMDLENHGKHAFLLFSLVVDRCDAVDLNVKSTVPGGDADEDARRIIFRKISPVDLVYVGEQINGRAVNVALQHVL